MNDYFKIIELNKLINIISPSREKETITEGYIKSLKDKVKLMQEAQDFKEKEMLDDFIQNINKRIMEIEKLSSNYFIGKDSVLYELKDLKASQEERLSKLERKEK